MGIFLGANNLKKTGLFDIYGHKKARGTIHFVFLAFLLKTGFKPALFYDEKQYPYLYRHY